LSHAIIRVFDQSILCSSFTACFSSALSEWQLVINLKCCFLRLLKISSRSRYKTGEQLISAAHFNAARLRCSAWRDRKHHPF